MPGASARARPAAGASESGCLPISEYLPSSETFTVVLLIPPTRGWEKIWVVPAPAVAVAVVQPRRRGGMISCSSSWGEEGEGLWLKLGSAGGLRIGLQGTRRTVSRIVIFVVGILATVDNDSQQTAG